MQGATAASEKLHHMAHQHEEKQKLAKEQSETMAEHIVQVSGVL